MIIVLFFSSSVCTFSGSHTHIVNDVYVISWVMMMMTMRRIDEESLSLTLMRIFLFSWLGEGRPSAEMSTVLVSSISPNTFLKLTAMFRCCTMLQWSSMDRIMG